MGVGGVLWETFLTPPHIQARSEIPASVLEEPWVLLMVLNFNPTLSFMSSVMPFHHVPSLFKRLCVPGGVWCSGWEDFHYYPAMSAGVTRSLLPPINTESPEALVGENWWQDQEQLSMHKPEGWPELEAGRQACSFCLWDFLASNKQNCRVSTLGVIDYRTRDLIHPNLVWAWLPSFPLTDTLLRLRLSWKPLQKFPHIGKQQRSEPEIWLSCWNESG